VKIGIYNENIDKYLKILNHFFHNMSFILPFVIEIFLSVLICLFASLYLFIINIGFKRDNFSLNFFVLLLFIVCIIVIYISTKDIELFYFIDRFWVVEGNNFIIKLFLLIQFLILCIFIPTNQNVLSTLRLIILLLFSILGLNIALSSRDLVLLYVGLEISSIPIYIMVSNNSSMISIEAGIKYYILGAISSCFFLLGISLMYGLIGSTLYEMLYIYEFYAYNMDTIYLSLCYLLLLVIFLFKIGIYPFNLWITNFNEGASLIIVFFLAVIPKLPYIYMLIMLSFNIFPTFHFINIILISLSLITIISSLVEGLSDNHIGRILGQSSMINMSIVFITILCLVLLQESLLFFLFLFYFIPTLLLFSLLSLKDISHNKRDLPMLQDTYFINNYLITIFYLTIISLSGLPFLAGFVGKWYIFKFLVEYNSIKIVVLLLITSMLASLFYTRIFFYIINRIRFNNIKIRKESYLKYFLVVFMAVVNFFIIILQEPLLGCLLLLW